MCNWPQKCVVVSKNYQCILTALGKFIVNYNFEDDIDNKFSVITQPNLCFWFRIKVQTVRAFEKNLQQNQGD